jgi:hypothetical protein
MEIESVDLNIETCLVFSIMRGLFSKPRRGSFKCRCVPFCNLAAACRSARGVSTMAGFPGFDTSAYPGDSIMSWLKANTNLVWSGFYLGTAPSHPNKGWMTKRAKLLQQGWGLAPLYVGQQVTGPGSHHTSGPQGTKDAADAAALMTSAGFPAGACVYLDLENGPPLTPAQEDYAAHWVDALTTYGFAPGIYCSHGFAAQIHQLRSKARIWAFKVSTTAPHPVPGHNYPDLHPAGSGYAGAYAWQLGQACLIDVPLASGGTLKVDLDTAVAPDPSQ